MNRINRTSVPICDIGALRNGSAREQARIVLDIGAAARDLGFFTIVNHGIPEYLSQRAFAAAQRFFGRSAGTLTRDQAVRLIAVLPDPLNWSATHPSGYVRQRDEIIGRRLGTLGALLDCVR